jgi:putative flippase GtrA
MRASNAPTANLAFQSEVKALVAQDQRASFTNDGKPMTQAAVSLLISQVIRYGITGGIVTALAVAFYWTVATVFGVHPLLANFLAYLVALASGYVMHSRWSFKGHGRRDDVARTGGRFFIVSLVSLGLNSVWVWLLTDLLHGPTWWPVVPMLLVTPAVTFAFNRHWVFG